MSDLIVLFATVFGSLLLVCFIIVGFLVGFCLFTESKAAWEIALGVFFMILCASITITWIIRLKEYQEKKVVENPKQVEVKLE